ncbi:MAG: uroporphyrinogen-III synthase [Pseudomonadota bacterium]|nr:uroporphyrinogen-III synthase [Pseudomonadota bacterium]
MTTRPNQPKPLQGWTVLSLRPRGQHGGLRAAASRRGAHVLALSPFMIEPLTDQVHGNSLEQALAADITVWTSPNAVRAAGALRPLRARPGQLWLAVGSSTQRALQRAGIDACAPSRMDSEGLLAMPELQDIRARSIGLVTAPGGRGMLAPSLADRGARVIRADVYARRTIAISPRALRALDAALATPDRVLLVVSSQEALQCLFIARPPDAHAALADIAVVTASQRLAMVASTAGFQRIAVATSATPGPLLQAAARTFT